jgi:hypothetical protein
VRVHATHGTGVDGAWERSARPRTLHPHSRRTHREPRLRSRWARAVPSARRALLFGGVSLQRRLHAAVPRQPRRDSGGAVRPQPHSTRRAAPPTATPAVGSSTPGRRPVEAERCIGVGHECTCHVRCLSGHRRCGKRPRRAALPPGDLLCRRLLTTPASVQCGSGSGGGCATWWLACSVAPALRNRGTGGSTEPTFLEASRPLPPSRGRDAAAGKVLGQISWYHGAVVSVGHQHSPVVRVLTFGHWDDGVGQVKPTEEDQAGNMDMGA